MNCAPMAMCEHRVARRDGQRHQSRRAPAHVSAAHLVADVARGHAVYSGGSRLWQGDSVIEGDTVELDNPSHILVARGTYVGSSPRRLDTKGGPRRGGLRTQARNSGTCEEGC